MIFVSVRQNQRGRCRLHILPENRNSGWKYQLRKAFLRENPFPRPRLSFHRRNGCPYNSSRIRRCRRAVLFQFYSLLSIYSLINLIKFHRDFITKRQFLFDCRLKSVLPAQSAAPLSRLSQKPSSKSVQARKTSVQIREKFVQVREMAFRQMKHSFR